MIEAGAVKDGHMPFVQGISAMAISVTSLGVGASAEHEGPMVHLGTTLAALLRHKDVPLAYNRALMVRQAPPQR